MTEEEAIEIATSVVARQSLSADYKLFYARRQTLSSCRNGMFKMIEEDSDLPPALVGNPLPFSSWSNFLVFHAGHSQTTVHRIGVRKFDDLIEKLIECKIKLRSV